MVAFSCCVYDGGKKEEEDMKAARERGWKGKFTKPGRVIRPGANRINGKCPLTPLEVTFVASMLLYCQLTFIVNYAFESCYCSFKIVKPSDFTILSVPMYGKSF